MKIYEVSFDFGDGKEKQSFSMPAIAATARAAESNVSKLYLFLSGGVRPMNVKANAVVFGADGAGKSLNKLKRKK